MAVGNLTRIHVARATLGATVATLYTIPTSRKLNWLQLSLTNTSAATEYLPYLYLVESGGSAGAANLLINGVSGYSGLQPGEHRAYSENCFLAVGGTIQGYANTAGVISCGIDLVLEEV